MTDDDLHRTILLTAQRNPLASDAKLGALVECPTSTVRTVKDRYRTYAEIRALFADERVDVDQLYNDLYF